MKSPSGIAKIAFVLISLLTISFALVSCDPGGEVTFQNQRNENIKVFVASVRPDGSIDGFVDFGTIPAQTLKKISITFLGDEWVNRLQIRDTLGAVISSRDYKMGDLEKIGWKITIPP